MIEVIDAIGSGIPVPETDSDSAPYFAALARGEFVLQYIPNEGWQHYPRPALLYPESAQPEFRPASGLGQVHTFTIIRQHGVPYFKHRLPYVLAIIELTEGVRMMGNVSDIEPGDVQIGLPVELYAMKVAEDIAIPYWRPRRG
jgi:uncharacterized OB-fold protein